MKPLRIETPKKKHTTPHDQTVVSSGLVGRHFTTQHKQSIWQKSHVLYYKPFLETFSGTKAANEKVLRVRTNTISDNN